MQALVLRLLRDLPGLADLRVRAAAIGDELERENGRLEKAVRAGKPSGKNIKFFQEALRACCAEAIKQR